MNTIRENMKDLLPELIRDLPAVMRPGSRLATLGVEALKDVELLALAVRSRSMRNPEELLSRHSMKELLAMSMARLASLRGIGHAGAAALLAAAELTRRTDKSIESGIPTLLSVNDVAAQAIEIRDKKKEYLLAFFLNARHQLIAKEVISIGTLTASLAHPRLCCAAHKRGYVLFGVMWCRAGGSNHCSSEIDAAITTGHNINWRSHGG